MLLFKSGNDQGDMIFDKNFVTRPLCKALDTQYTSLLSNQFFKNVLGMEISLKIIRKKAVLFERCELDLFHENIQKMFRVVIPIFWGIAL